MIVRAPSCSSSSSAAKPSPKIGTSNDFAVSYALVAAGAGVALVPELGRPAIAAMLDALTAR